MHASAGAQTWRPHSAATQASQPALPAAATGGGSGMFQSQAPLEAMMGGGDDDDEDGGSDDDTDDDNANILNPLQLQTRRTPIVVAV